MYILETYGSAVLFCFVTMLCWGSWANTQKVTTKGWRFELFYWDYVFGILLLAFVFGITLGNNGGPGRRFFLDLLQAESRHILSAVAGGFIFNLANILLVTAISLVGMAVAFPVGIGIALILGVIVNFIATPSGQPILLFAGVTLVICAILLDAKAYQKIAVKKNQVSVRALSIAILSGILMGFFYRFVASAMTPHFSQPEAGKLGPYAAVFLFCGGVFLSSFIFVPILMKHPISGGPLKISDYFKGTIRNHLIGVLGGVIWCIGMSFSILAADKAGFAISYGLGQGATMVAAAWGIFFWKEFKGAPKGTNKLLTIMMMSYILGLSAIILARVYG